jgi:hypothetical protein
VGLVVAMAKIADADNQSVPTCVAVTIGVSIVCIVLIPLPFLRLGVAGAATFVLMMVAKSRAA